MSPPLIQATNSNSESSHHLNLLQRQNQPQQQETKTPVQPKEFRKLVRTNQFTSPTNGICSDYLQCNLVILRKEDAFDFLLFCQRNEKACPLIEVCDVGSSLPKYCCFNNIVDDDNNDDNGEVSADLKTDVPRLVFSELYFHLICINMKI